MLYVRPYIGDHTKISEMQQKMFPFIGENSGDF